MRNANKKKKISKFFNKILRVQNVIIKVFIKSP